MGMRYPCPKCHISLCILFVFLFTVLVTIVDGRRAQWCPATDSTGPGPSMSSLYVDYHESLPLITAFEFDWVYKQPTTLTPSQPTMVRISTDPLVSSASIRVLSSPPLCVYTSDMYPSPQPLIVEMTPKQPYQSWQSISSHYNTSSAQFTSSIVLTAPITSELTLQPQTLHISCMMSLSFLGSSLLYFDTQPSDAPLPPTTQSCLVSSLSSTVPQILFNHATSGINFVRVRLTHTSLEELIPSIRVPHDLLLGGRLFSVIPHNPSYDALQLQHSYAIRYLLGKGIPIYEEIDDLLPFPTRGSIVGYIYLPESGMGLRGTYYTDSSPIALTVTNKISFDLTLPLLLTQGRQTPEELSITAAAGTPLFPRPQTSYINITGYNNVYTAHIYHRYDSLDASRIPISILEDERYDQCHVFIFDLNSDIRSPWTIDITLVGVEIKYASCMLLPLSDPPTFSKVQYPEDNMVNFPGLQQNAECVILFDPKDTINATVQPIIQARSISTAVLKHSFFDVFSQMVDISSHTDDNSTISTSFYPRYLPFIDQGVLHSPLLYHVSQRSVHANNFVSTTDAPTPGAPTPGAEIQLVSHGLLVDWEFQFTGTTTNPDVNPYLVVWTFSLPNVSQVFQVVGGGAPAHVPSCAIYESSEMHMPITPDSTPTAELFPERLHVFNLDQTIFTPPHFTSRLIVPLTGLQLNHGLYYTIQCRFPQVYDQYVFQLDTPVQVGATIIPSSDHISLPLFSNVTDMGDPSSSTTLASISTATQDTPSIPVHHVDVYRLFQVVDIHEGPSNVPTTARNHITYDDISQAIYELISLYDSADLITSFFIRYYSDYTELGSAPSPPYNVSRRHAFHSIPLRAGNDIRDRFEFDIPPFTTIPSLVFPLIYLEIVLVKASPEVTPQRSLSTLSPRFTDSIEHVTSVTTYSMDNGCLTPTQDLHLVPLPDYVEAPPIPVLSQSMCSSPCQNECIVDWFCMVDGQRFNSLFSDNQCDRSALPLCTPSFIGPLDSQHRCGYIGSDDTFVQVPDHVCHDQRRVKYPPRSAEIPASCTRSQVVADTKSHFNIDVFINYYCYANDTPHGEQLMFNQDDSYGCNRSLTTKPFRDCGCPCVDQPPYNTCGFMVEPSMLTPDHPSWDLSSRWFITLPNAVCSETPRIRTHQIIASRPMYMECRSPTLFLYINGIPVEDGAYMFKDQKLEIRWPYVSVDIVDTFRLSPVSNTTPRIDVPNIHLDPDDPDYLGGFHSVFIDPEPFLVNGRVKFNFFFFSNGRTVSGATNLLSITYSTKTCSETVKESCVGITITSMSYTPGADYAVVKWRPIRTAVGTTTPTTAPLRPEQIPYVFIQAIPNSPQSLYIPVRIGDEHGPLLIDERVGEARVHFHASMIDTPDDPMVFRFRVVPSHLPDRFYASPPSSQYAIGLWNRFCDNPSNNMCQDRNNGECSSFLRGCSCYHDVFTSTCSHDLLFDQLEYISSCTVPSSSTYRNCRNRGEHVVQPPRLAGSAPNCDCSCQHFFSTPAQHSSSGFVPRCSECRLSTLGPIACEGLSIADEQCSGCYCTTLDCKRLRVSTLLYITFKQIDVVHLQFGNLNDYVVFLSSALSNDLAIALDIPGITVVARPMFLSTPNLLKVTVTFPEHQLYFSVSEATAALQHLTAQWASMMNNFDAITTINPSAAAAISSVSDIRSVRFTGLDFDRQPHPESLTVPANTHPVMNEVFSPHDKSFVLCRSVSNANKLLPCDDVMAGFPITPELWSPCPNNASSPSSVRRMTPICFDFLGRQLSSDLCTPGEFPFYPSITTLSCTTATAAPADGVDRVNKHRCLNGFTGTRCETPPVVNTPIISSTTFRTDPVRLSSTGFATSPSQPPTITINPSLREFSYLDVTWDYTGDAFNTLTILLMVSSSTTPPSLDVKMDQSMVLASGVPAQLGMASVLRIPSLPQRMLSSTAQARILFILESNAGSGVALAQSSPLSLGRVSRLCPPNQSFSELEGRCVCVDGFKPSGTSCVPECTGVCGARGVCDVSFSPTLCKCNDGFIGHRCEFSLSCQRLSPTPPPAPPTPSDDQHQPPQDGKTSSPHSPHSSFHGSLQLGQTIPSNITTLQCGNGLTPSDPTTSQCLTSECICHPSWEVDPSSVRCTFCTLRNVCDPRGTSEQTFKEDACSKCLCKKGYAGTYCEIPVSYLTVLVNPSAVGVDTTDTTSQGFIVLSKQQLEAAAKVLPTHRNLLHSIPHTTITTTEREMASVLGIPYYNIQLIQVTSHLMATPDQSSAPPASGAAYQLVFAVRNTIDNANGGLTPSLRLVDLAPLWQYTLDRLHLSLLPNIAFPTVLQDDLKQLETTSMHRSSLSSPNSQSPPLSQGGRFTSLDSSTTHIAVVNQVYNVNCRQSGCNGVDNLLPELFPDIPDSGKGGLSGATITYIAVGVVVGLLLVLFIVLLILLRYFRKHQMYCFKEKKKKGKSKLHRTGSGRANETEMFSASGNKSVPEQVTSHVPTQVFPTDGEAVDGDGTSLPLPEGWIILRDPQSGKIFYSNKDTMESRWNHPSLESQTDKKVNQYGW